MNIRINFTSPETRRIVLPEAEDCTIVCSFAWTKHRNETDGQTDRRTDGRTDKQISSDLQRSALRALRTRCKNQRGSPCRQKLLSRAASDC